MKLARPAVAIQNGNGPYAHKYGNGSDTKRPLKILRPQAPQADKLADFDEVPRKLVLSLSLAMASTTSTLERGPCNQACATSSLIQRDTGIIWRPEWPTQTLPYMWT